MAGPGAPSSESTGDVQFEAGSASAAFVVLHAIAVGAWLAATWRYRRADVD